jgi:hypothetical protein
MEFQLADPAPTEQDMLKIYHLAGLTKAEAKRLNSSTGGWDSEARFARYADITSFADSAQIVTALLEREYNLVAVVDSTNLDDGFTSTNHIESDWRENDDVTALPGEHRSTSVGDLIVSEDEVTYIVDRFGFNRLGSAS